MVKIQPIIDIMKALVVVSLITAIGIAGYEITWFGKSSLAPVIFGLAVVLVLQGIYLIQLK